MHLGLVSTCYIIIFPHSVAFDVYIQAVLGRSAPFGLECFRFWDYSQSSLSTLPFLAALFYIAVLPVWPKS
jgi:hypothetical protein